LRKGHILILVENLPVPFDRRVWMESTALTEAGYKVSVISPCPPEELGTPDRVIDGIHVYRYPMPSPTKSKLSFIREFAYCFKETSKLTARIWAQDRFDCIHTCNPPDTFWGIGRRYKRYGVKFVFDHHDLCPELYISKFNRRDIFLRGLEWFERQQFRTADAVIATNESYRQIAISRGRKRPEDVTVVRSGPLISRFTRVEPDPRLRRGKAHLAVYLGVMGPQDGVDYALRAIRAAIDSGMTDTAFAMIGGGDSFEDLVRLNKELRLENDVLFTGRVSDDELRRYLSTAEMGIAPDPKNALNDVSTMNKIVEYMAMSLPIVSFDLVESRYSAGDAAIYISNDNAEAMGIAMRDLMRDPDKRRRMGELGRKRFESELAWDYSRTALVAFYDRLLGERAA
jgi:glycosyltransferase involved in cell wall biosynthesis